MNLECEKVDRVIVYLIQERLKIKILLSRAAKYTEYFLYFDYSRTKYLNRYYKSLFISNVEQLWKEVYGSILLYIHPAQCRFAYE